MKLYPHLFSTEPFSVSILMSYDVGNRNPQNGMLIIKKQRPTSRQTNVS